MTLEGTQELMKAREVAAILATGGMGLVRAGLQCRQACVWRLARQCAVLHRTLRRTSEGGTRRRSGKTFDNACPAFAELRRGRRTDREDARRQFQALGAYFLKDAEADALAKVLVTAQRLPNPALVGRPASVVAEKAGLKVPDGTKVLIAPLRSRPRLSVVDRETVPGAVVVRRQRLAAGCERCIEILRYGGMAT